MRTIAIALLFVSLVGTNGCGTLLNLGEPTPTPFGGAQMDSKIVIQGAPLGFKAWTGDIDIPSFWPLALIDLPISLAGDVVTLPITTWYAIQKH